MNLLLAQLASSPPLQDTATLWAGIVVLGLSTLASLGVSVMTFFRMAGGKDSERKVEPTQNHAVMAELKTQTTMLSAINREVGEVKTAVSKVEVEMAGMHTRVGAISRDLAGTTAKVEGLEKRERHHRA